MIDRSLYAQQFPPGLTHQIVENAQSCLWSSCNWPPVIPPPGPGNGYVSAGFTQVCGLNVDVTGPDISVFLHGFFDYTPGVGDDLCSGCHAMVFRDNLPGGGFVDYDFTLSNPFGNVRYLRSEATNIVVSGIGTHGIALLYSAATTGLGFDILWAARLEMCA